MAAAKTTQAETPDAPTTPEFRFLPNREVVRLRPSEKQRYHKEMAKQDTGRIHEGHGGIAYVIVRTQYDPVQNEVIDTYVKEREIPNKRGGFDVVHTFVRTACKDEAIREKFRVSEDPTPVELTMDDITGEV